MPFDMNMENLQTNENSVFSQVRQSKEQTRNEMQASYRLRANLYSSVMGSKSKTRQSQVKSSLTNESADNKSQATTK